MWFERLMSIAAGTVALLFVIVLILTAIFAHRGTTAAAKARADAIIVLSAGFDEDRTLDPMSAARTDVGVALWKAGVAPNLVMSGGEDEELGLVMAEAMKARAVAAGVPASAVIAEGRSVSTFENARFVLEIAAAQKWETAVLVTDDFHLARSALLFRYWNQGRLEIVALAAARGRAGLPTGVAVWMLIREALAYPFNAAKILGQESLEALGGGDGRAIR